MIRKFTENIEKTVASTPLVISSNIQKQFDPEDEAVYLKGNLLFIDFSVLEIAIFANKSSNKIAVDK